jgi:large subunit ribosomal protein L13
MKTTYLAKTGEIAGRCLLFDAADVPLGRLAVRIADALRGKDRPTFTPHIDTGAFVIVVNAAKVKLTGTKEQTKIYQDFSGYRSGLRHTVAAEIRRRNPERFVRDAVWGMLPKGRLGRAQFRKLRVYAGADHPHTAQLPETVTL